MIDSTNELVAALESVNDTETAKAAAIRIESVCDRREALAAEARQVRISAAKSRELQEKVQKAMAALKSRVRAAQVSAAEKSQDEASFVQSLERLEKIPPNIEFASE